MKVMLNGEPYETEGAATVWELLERLKMHRRKVAVVVDDEVVRRGSYEETPLMPDCRIEILHPVGGG